MAERNPQIPHSIQTLLYVERRGKYCGYKPELITDTISSDWKEFLICSECKGISRSARHVAGNTVCEMCVTGRGRDADERVENKVKSLTLCKVASLKSKCPLRGDGCGWEGKLRKIEQHMQDCSKMLVECQLKCGIRFERETTEQHNREICPLRMIECQYCKEEIQVKGENLHIGECVNHPDTEVPCPYKELGCDVITLRKNKDIHLTENMIGHQKLVLDQLNQLRNRNQQLELLNEEQKNKNEEQKNKNEEQKNRIRTIETSVAEREREYRVERNKGKRLGMVWVIIGLVAAGIAVAVSLGNNIQHNSQQIQVNSEQTNSNLQRIQANSQETNSNLQRIQANSQQTNSNLQKIQANSQQTNSNLQKIQANSQQTNSNLQKIQVNSQQTNSNLQKIQVNSEQTNSNLQKIQANSQQTNSNLQKIQANSQQTNSNLQKIQVNSQQTNSNLQKIQANSQQTNSYSQQIQAIKDQLDYIIDNLSERGKTLARIEWKHGFINRGDIHGPTFYLGKCKLRLKAYIFSSSDRTYYSVERLNGEYDDSISSCLITYIYSTYGYTDELKPIDTYSSDTKRNLNVGDSSHFDLIDWVPSDREVIIIFYFDIKVD